MLPLRAIAADTGRSGSCPHQLLPWGLPYAAGVGGVTVDSPRWKVTVGRWCDGKRRLTTSAALHTSHDITVSHNWHPHNIASILRTAAGLGLGLGWGREEREGREGRVG